METAEQFVSQKKVVFFMGFCGFGFLVAHYNEKPKAFNLCWLCFLVMNTKTQKTWREVGRLCSSCFVFLTLRLNLLLLLCKSSAMRIRKRPTFAPVAISLPAPPSPCNPIPQPPLPSVESHIPKNHASYLSHQLLHPQRNCHVPGNGHLQHEQDGNLLLRSCLPAIGHAMQRSSPPEIEAPRSCPYQRPDCKDNAGHRKKVDETSDTLSSVDGTRSCLAFCNIDGVDDADRELVRIDCPREATLSSDSQENVIGYSGSEYKDAYPSDELVLDSLQKRKKISRNKLPPSSTFAERYSGRNRFITGFTPEGSLPSVLFHIVSEAGKDGITVCEAVKRLTALKYTQLLEADGLPRPIQVGKVLRSNPRIAELGNGKFVMRKDELEGTNADVGSDTGKDKEEINTNDRGRRVAESEGVKKRCNRKDGRGWQCPQRALDGYSYCEYHLVKVQANHARSIQRLASTKRMKKRGVGAPLLTFC